MKILITGGRGQLGRDCERVLAPMGSLVSGDLPAMDIADEAGMQRWFDEARPDVVVNCAAYTQVDKCESEEALAAKVNAEGPRVLAELAKANGAFFVHVSTDYVFDGTRPVPQPYTEDDPTGPASAYGRTKVAGEEAVLQAGGEAAILRTAWLYGADGHNFLKTMLRLALADPAAERRVVNDQFGSPTWSYRLAHQVAAVIEQRATGVFHATAEGYGTWYDLATCFLEAMEVPHCLVPCATEAYPTPARRPSNSILENRRLKQLNLNVMQNWIDDVKEYARMNRVQLLAECGEQT
jgi:dTDP-4-dehydrorhamnose reductase